MSTPLHTKLTKALGNKTKYFPELKKIFARPLIQREFNKLQLF